MLKCAIGIMAYNEEKNVGHLLRALIEQKQDRVAITDICVVSSGSTDRTNAIVEEFARADPRVRLLVQDKREGKVSAVNMWLSRVDEEVVVLESADTIPGPDTIEKLVMPFADPEIGMTGGRPMPVNDKDTFIGFAVYMMWLLHHKIALQTPKLGEMIAFRRIFRRLHPTAVVDEANIEPLIHNQGYRLKYVPEAVVSNKGPLTLSDFIVQRRRNHAGHIALIKRQGYTVSTLSPLKIIRTILGTPELMKLKYLPWIPAVMLLEAYGRFLGARDFKHGGKDHAIWEMATTTKELVNDQTIK